MPSHIVLTDTRMVIKGHAENKVACLALSVATQATARILAAQGFLARPVEIDVEEGFLDMQITDDIDAKRGMAGLISSIHKLAQNFPGAYLLADNRTVELAFPEMSATVDNIETTESFADEFMANREVTTLTDSQGRPLKAVE